MAGLIAGIPARIQKGAGPPWADAPETEIRMLNRMLRSALVLVVQTQRDMSVNRDVFLEQLWLMAHGKVADAQELVPRAQDCGGAHGKLAWISDKFGPQVLTEVHDLLFQLTRPDQVSLVLGVLETQFKKSADLAAIGRLCGPDGPDGPDAHAQLAHPDLTDQGRMLWQLLLYASPALRSEGHKLFSKEMIENAQLLSARATPSLLATMPSAGSGSPSRAFCARRGRPPSSGSPSSSSSHTPESEASSPSGSAEKKRHQRSIVSAPVADGPTQGEGIAGSAES